MNRDLRYKLLTLVFGSIALIAISACAVASSPTTSSDSEQVEQSDSDDSNSDVEIESVEQVEPDPTPTIEPEDESPSVQETPTPAAHDDGDEATRSESDSDGPEGDSEELPVPGNPTRLQVDSIDIDAGFEYVGVDDKGNMDVPQEWENVAWYEPGTVPGDVGNAVVAGHYDSYTDPAVFYDLKDLEVGDEIRIVTEDDEELIFEITEIESVHVDDADTRKLFGPTDERNLNLVTCEGVWDTDAGMYDHRLIVYSTLVESD